MCKSHKIFKILGVKTRIKILKILKNNESMGVNELSEKLGITASAVSQHLKAMKELNLVQSHRDGYKIPYSLNKKMLNNCKDMLDDVCDCGCHEKNDIDNLNDLEKLKKYRNNLYEQLNIIETKIEFLEKEKE